MPSNLYEYDNSNPTRRFHVPADVQIITITLRGGGASGNPAGGVTGKLKVNPGDVIFMDIGQDGRPATGSGSRVGGAVAHGGGGPGGDGTGTGNGGDGGGGATVIRKNGPDGQLLAVAAGAGGDSGGNGQGGHGGAVTGGPGEKGTGTAGGAAATGGTQNQGGRGGTTPLGAAFYGGDGGGNLGRGGAGGQRATGVNVSGGGGGGGGYYPGGGGQAGRSGTNASWGGAGGSNWAGGLYSVTSVRGVGTLGHGAVLIEWDDPTTPPPVPPVDITIDGVPIADGLATRATTEVLLRGQPNSPDHDLGLRMWVAMSTTKDFAEYKTFVGTYDPAEFRDKVQITGLVQDKRYYLRLFTQDSNKQISTNYRSTNFWTNRRPNAPTPIEPAENVEVTPLLNVLFTWTHSDPDGPEDAQTGFVLRYRAIGTPAVPAGDWITLPVNMTTVSEYTADAGDFKGHTFYEWQVRTRDEQGAWGDFSLPMSFYVAASTQPPLLISPVNKEAVPVIVGNHDFRWKFRSPTMDVQERGDIRMRAFNPTNGPEEGWTLIPGDTSNPGINPVMEVEITDLEVGYLYEWEARTYTAAAAASDWSDPGLFYAVAPPGSGAGLNLLDSGRPAAPLAQGINRVFVYERGGKRLLGEITRMSLVRWNRQRDDISGCTIMINEWDAEAKQFLGNLRTWMHELVVFRDNGEEMQRVWEGPITRISGSKERVEVEAKDVMAYVYRRIMQQGYNDAYRLINGVQVGQKTVVQRASQIIMNCLAYDDPNVLAYLTPLHDPFDARTSRVVKDFAKTAFEEVDDLAAVAGLDYVCSGRRIILWDTHRAIGRLPEMRDGDFSEPPIVTEYGMSAANIFSVTNNAGIYGSAVRGFAREPDGTLIVPPQGFIEQLASAYGEDSSGATTDVLTREKRLALIANLTAQANRNITGRWTPPVVARIPDNATLNPDLNITINQLIPGVWIPLRASGGVREVSQWQKLDSMTVEQTGDGEKVAVVMSPAPQGGADPDADEAAVAE